MCNQQLEHSVQGNKRILTDSPLPCVLVRYLLNPILRLRLRSQLKVVSRQESPPSRLNFYHKPLVALWVCDLWLVPVPQQVPL